ncbi:hypothetical protein BAUCODRAFT_183973 [Baudoinia panamericana UAMH 10762]|uniref:Catalase core domain-containing protein n=1 Tax=Baudoinia panamericana (strain UAMH 10762) TaxID=717646 RepID=M2M183_BAUPA|nr:uncharacterized protein BAUCODRAFT_183973 [Baudoinia panamericana UAMH 10762]EMD00803.1 hypothetical protein BAUCODRAFT_183973 [Baudoinia panamericana UAMH 10762]
MPLPGDQATVETAGNLVKTLHGAFGEHSGYRPAHAKGRLVTGSFTPTADAASLSSAPHFNNASTPVIVRFSASTGLPDIPDTDANAMPRGFAIRFNLGNNGHKHTDIVAHSVKAFPVRTGEEFLAMLNAIGSGSIGEFLQKNPSAAYFVKAPKPAPVSVATERYHALNAFKLVSKDGKGTFVRYSIDPVAGCEFLSGTELANKPKNYLTEELAERLSNGGIGYKLVAELAEEGDPTDDVTKHWPESRKKVELGTIQLDKLMPETESLKQQKHIIFDPIPRVEGVEVSDDPLLDMRAAVYLISGKERRAAPEVTMATVT